MKEYMKPELEALPLEGNDNIQGCTFDAVGSNMDPVIRRLLGDKADQPGLFANGEACKNPVDISGYCKYGPSGNMVFNS